MANRTQYQLNRRGSNRIVYTKIAVQNMIHLRRCSLTQKPQTCNQRFILKMKLKVKHPGNGYRKPDSLLVLLYWSLTINGCYIDQIIRPLLFWDVMWRRIVVGYRRFGITCQFHSEEFQELWLNFRVTPQKRKGLKYTASQLYSNPDDKEYKSINLLSKLC